MLHASVSATTAAGVFSPAREREGGGVRTPRRWRKCGKSNSQMAEMICGLEGSTEFWVPVHQEGELRCVQAQESQHGWAEE